MADKEKCPDVSDDIEKITPMDVEAYLMTHWREILKASSRPIAADGVENT